MATNPAERHVDGVLGEGEQIQFRAEVLDAMVAVTDRRLAIADDYRLMLDAPFEGLRRIQFDIERERPATLVVVPESPRQSPVVLAITTGAVRDRRRGPGAYRAKARRDIRGGRCPGLSRNAIAAHLEDCRRRVAHQTPHSLTGSVRPTHSLAPAAPVIGEAAMTTNDPHREDETELDAGAYIGREPELEEESIPGGVTERDERVSAYDSQPGVPGEPDDRDGSSEPAEGDGGDQAG